MAREGEVWVARSSSNVFLAAGSGAFETRATVNWPFAKDSPWNIPLSNSATLQNLTDAQSANLNDAASHLTGINSESFSIAVFQASAGDPVVDLHWVDVVSPFTDHGHFFIQIPASATPDTGENTMSIVSADGTQVNDLFEFSWTNVGVTANVGTIGNYNLTGSGLNGGGPRAYGGTFFGGLIRQYDLNQGAIRHALALAVSNDQLFATNAGGPCVGWVWPAFSQDTTACSTPYDGLNPQGTLACISPSTTAASIGISTKFGLMLFHAAQDYGVYVVDRTDTRHTGDPGNGNDVFYAETGISSTFLSTVRGGEFPLDAIRHHLVVVTNNASATPGGAAYDGTATNRRAPLAWEF